ncbi:hypothetical protein PHYBLDRAFT_174549 [Phycomyces blakesleeanus NRRL 1555(-)]|uniref:Uncharacterized protein n=1 Tax=Phycomyces blakesleeanus (strain ATCC 8743b / DSM 1359 / FGSC 10004 / NBRC 33097 / NRRL 1555) TaxID=763407 RepID=A0A162WHL6_PHYB8|nr:hypothetical protein PHYBLDRAFT_174549 [Phycomyces blakesleeanus NRRL 1555(-)]OAD67165.1 hypothetical protein PHYBLDRAFT_174549 [Phycomyces blakesleeanus NRRL 1555(-)]|eukprot:XP_018285205.1 hypothetical protein PHYBLDRAFT_174549 [Phycomyces blakesleeanus NRRL 1555(-)]
MTMVIRYFVWTRKDCTSVYMSYCKQARCKEVPGGQPLSTLVPLSDHDLTVKKLYLKKLCRMDAFGEADKERWIAYLPVSLRESFKWDNQIYKRRMEKKNKTQQDISDSSFSFLNVSKTGDAESPIMTDILQFSSKDAGGASFKREAKEHILTLLISPV